MILIFAILSFFSFCRGGGAPPSQVLGEGAPPAAPPLVAPLAEIVPNNSIGSYYTAEIVSNNIIDSYSTAEIVSNKVIVILLQR